MDEWHTKLQELLKQAVQSSTSQDWLKENSYISCEIWDIENEFKVERFEKSKEELKVYARIGDAITSLYQVQQIIYKVLIYAAEDFLVLVPLHTSKAFQFWFITGHQSHGHIVKIIIERDKHPYIQS